MVCDMLERSGYQVCAASSTKEALALFHDRPIDVMLTDRVMSEREGVEPTEDLRDGFPNLKIVVMSGAPRPR